MSFLKETARKVLPHALVRGYRARKDNVERCRLVEEWRAAGCPVPPAHAYKQQAVLDFASRYRLRTFIETGTSQGEMVAAMRDHFREIYTVELSHDLYLRAQERFKNDGHVRVIEGDSGKVLSEIITRINPPALFWLDAHYSEGETARGDIDTPIEQELRTIFSLGGGRHVVLIDDARDFNGTNGYPTLDRLRASLPPSVSMSVEHDIIRIEPTQ